MKGLINVTNYSENVQSWYMPETVKGTYVDPRGSARARSIAVHIPVLMPAIPFGNRKIQSKSISKACFCNDTKCKPAIASSIRTQNYLVLNVYDNQEFKHSLFDQGAGFYIDAINGNYDNMRITHRQDDSYDPWY